MQLSDLAEGVSRGVFRGIDPDLVAEVFSFAYRRASDPEFLARTKLSMPEAYREVGQLLRHGILHPESKTLKVKGSAFVASSPNRESAANRDNGS